MLSFFLYYFPDFAECHANAFKCNSMACIDISLQCDGKYDCLAGEDERDCSKSLNVYYNNSDGRV